MTKAAETVAVRAMRNLLWVSGGSDARRAEKFPGFCQEWIRYASRGRGRPISALPPALATRRLRRPRRTRLPSRRRFARGPALGSRAPQRRGTLLRLWHNVRGVIQRHHRPLPLRFATPGPLLPLA